MQVQLRAFPTTRHAAIFVAGAHTETAPVARGIYCSAHDTSAYSRGSPPARGAVLLFVSLQTGTTGERFCSPSCTSTTAPGTFRASPALCGVTGPEHSVLSRHVVGKKQKSPPHRTPWQRLRRHTPPHCAEESSECQGASTDPSEDLRFHGHTDATVPSRGESPTGTRIAQPNQEPCVGQAREDRCVHPTAPQLPAEERCRTLFACQRSGAADMCLARLPATRGSSLRELPPCPCNPGSTRPRCPVLTPWARGTRHPPRTPVTRLMR